MQYLSDDLARSTIPFQDMIAPTDLDRVAHAMGDIIGKKYSDFSLLNPFSDWWRIVGMDSNNVKTWLEQYVSVSRTRNDTLTYATRESYRQDMMGRFGYSSSDMDVYFDAFFQLKDSRMIPASIENPAGYTIPASSGSIAAEVGTAIGQVVSGASKSIWPQVILFGVLGVAAYAWFGKGLPRIIEKKI
jgi:hypothetical protein